jgi:hypothetical protein
MPLEITKTADRKQAEEIRLRVSAGDVGLGTEFRAASRKQTSPAADAPRIIW